MKKACRELSINVVSRRGFCEFEMGRRVWAVTDGGNKDLGDDGEERRKSD